jgi:lysosomal alpha-glucosidase
MLTVILILCNLWYATSTPLSTSQPICDIPNKNARFDCHPDPGASPSRCTARGCCWQTSVSSSVGDINVPACFFPSNYDGYKIISQKETDYGYHAVLSRTSSSGWPNDVQTLSLDIRMETDQRLHFKVRYAVDHISILVVLDDGFL